MVWYATDKQFQGLSAAETRNDDSSNFDRAGGGPVSNTVHGRGGLAINTMDDDGQASALHGTARPSDPGSSRLHTSASRHASCRRREDVVRDDLIVSVGPRRRPLRPESIRARSRWQRGAAGSTSAARPKAVARARRCTCGRHKASAEEEGDGARRRPDWRGRLCNGRGWSGHPGLRGSPIDDEPGSRP